MSQVVTTPQVLTIKEAAEYLRVSEDVVERLAMQQGMPARRIGNEWRFFKPALDAWLASSNGKGALLAQAGALADDPSLLDMLESIYRERGRPEVADD